MGTQLQPKESAFKRGQVAWAAWQVFSRHGPDDPRRTNIPTMFLTRIRKMGELGVPLAAAERPGQSGRDIEYSLYHAFELTTALMLQDMGLKQAEVAYFVQEIRGRLRGVLDLILANPPSSREPIDARARPDLPSSTMPDGFIYADTSCFMVFRYVELVEAWNWKDDANRKTFFTYPEFCFGAEALKNQFMKLSFKPHDHSRLIVELSFVVALLVEYLDKAPVVKRGRK